MASPRFRTSTTHAALSKIIAIISTVPSPPPSQPTVGTDPDEGRSNCKRGLGIDLNLRLGPWPDRGIGSVDGGGGPTACSGIVDGSEALVESGVVSSFEKKPLSAEGSISGEALTADKSSQGECDPEDRGGLGRRKLTQGGGREYSEITNIPEETETEEEGMRRRNEGYLDLLLEAVRQVSGGLLSEGAEEKESSETETKVAVAAESAKRRGLDLYEEESGPVVRSKRGRSQALPSRYRDSVLEPWGKLPTVTRCSRAARR